MIVYSLVNRYYSSVQAGIQSSHSIVRLFTKYKDPNSEEYKMLFKWAEEIETLRLLQGGGHEDQLKFIEELKQTRIPYVEFYESANNNSCSSISFIMPPVLLELMSQIRSNGLTLMDVFRMKEQQNLDLYDAENLIFKVASFRACS